MSSCPDYCMDIACKGGHKYTVHLSSELWLHERCPQCDGELEYETYLSSEIGERAYRGSLVRRALCWIGLHSWAEVSIAPKGVFNLVGLDCKYCRKFQEV